MDRTAVGEYKIMCSCAYIHWRLVLNTATCDHGVFVGWLMCVILPIQESLSDIYVRIYCELISNECYISNIDL